MSRYGYLAHHGVKGQKWGIRNGPPYPIEDNVMKKGTKISTISPYVNPEKRGKWMYTYNQDDPWDSKVYKGGFSYYLRANRGDKVLAIHAYEAIKDLKMPTRKEREDNLKELWDKASRIEKSIYLKEANNFKNQMIKYNFGMDKQINKQLPSLNLKKLDTNNKDDFKKFYYMFNSMMEESYNFKLTRDYSKIMSDKFDAMVDDNNQGIYNKSHDPVIVFRAHEALKKIGMQMLPDKEILDNYNELKKELKDKYGQDYVQL